MGYWIGQSHAGRGIVPTAVAMATDYCLGTLGLHRMEINIRPENAASLRVVEKLGFRDEGLRAEVPAHRRRLAGPPELRPDPRGAPRTAAGPLAGHPARPPDRGLPGRLAAKSHQSQQPLERHTAAGPCCGRAARLPSVSVDPSSLIFVVIIGIWAVYLVQHWVRRREQLATSRSLDRFSDAMRVLERRAPIPVALPVSPEPPVRRRAGPPRRASPPPRLSRPPAPAAPRSP